MRLELLEYVNSHLPRGFVPYYIYSLIDDGREVGRLVYREGTDEECYYEGHVGYSVYEEFRGHRYAYQACLLLKDMIDKDHLIVTCDPANAASLAVIQRLGCQHIETVIIPYHFRKLFTSDEKVKMIYRWDIALL